MTNREYEEKQRELARRIIKNIVDETLTNGLSLVDSLVSGREVYSPKDLTKYSSKYLCGVITNDKV